MRELPKLNYAFDALEPHLDAATLEIHYNKHHLAYCNNFNAVLEKYPELAKKPDEEIIANLNNLAIDETDRQKIRDQGGGYINHNLFWKIMDPANSADKNLAEEIAAEFGSVEKFKELFSQTATTHFASGWVWLARANGRLKIYSLPNQDSPLTLGHTPMLTLDVWEHAYYLKYQNRRAEYIAAWWQTIKII